MQFRGVEVKMRDGLDVTDQVHQDMYHAWLDLQNLHRTHPGSQYKSMVSDKGWKVSSLSGVDEIKLLGGYHIVREEEKEEKKIKSEWKFVPGICMIALESTIDKWYGFEDIAQSYITVCNTPVWLGKCCIIPECAVVEQPGMKWPDYPARAVKGLVEYGYHAPWDEYWFNTESTTGGTVIQDNGFNPVPWLGHDSDGAIDYLTEELNNAGAYWTGADYFNGCDEQRIWYEDFRDYWNAQSDWSVGDQMHDNTKVCVHYDAEDCCDEYDGSTHYIPAGKCGLGHLFFSIQIEQTHCHPTYNPYKIDGICYGYSSVVDKVFTTGMLLPITTYGEPQDRTYVTTYSYDNYLQSYDIIDRAAGNLRSNYHSYTTISSHNLTMPAICVRNHLNTQQSVNDWPDVHELQGGYVKDADALLIPILKNKYFIMYVSEVYTVPPHTGYKTDNTWNLPAGKPAYDSLGVYAHGIPYNVSSPSNPTKFACLWADINGEQILVDSEDIETNYGYFVCTDSHIVTCLGNIYYMYAYCLWQYISGSYGVRRIRYGYFRNTVVNHIRSPIFLSSKYGPIGRLKTLAATFSETGKLQSK